MQFLVQDEISGQTLREKQRKSKIAMSLWLKTITGERLNPCTLSSSGVGGCMHLCQRHRDFYGKGDAALLHCREKPHACPICSCRASGSYQLE